MKVDDFNKLLTELDTNPGREQVMKTAFAFLEWMGLKPPKEGKERVLAPKKEDLKKHVTRHPLTNQYQFYRLTAESEPITVRFAFLKKVRKDQLVQLIDKETKADFQSAPPIIQTLPSAPPYFIHIVATPEENKLYLVLNKGDQKRIVAFKKKLTQTQFQKIVPQWENIAVKSKPEIAAQLWKSLDIKEVNKEFYKRIKEQFDALVGIAQVQQPDSKEEEVKQFAVRLIGRYIFCWFLKEKGIINEALLSSATINAYRKDFFQKYLYQLFFNTLNEEVPSRNPFKAGGTLEALYDTIPYLNGGLFDKHPEDALFKVLDLNDWLVAFVRVLEDFDFTVDESSSQYQQVAIDPEMLGRIFENLLASQNPETEKIANQRKAFGAFYTPREIVDYMVNQALKSYLEAALLPRDESIAAVVEEPLVDFKGTLFQDLEPQQTLINFDPAKKAIADQRRKRLQEHIDKLFSPDYASNPFDKGDVSLVQQKLSEVKILDPACGSGAFPMGVLLRLMELRQLVGHGHRNNYDLKSEILSRNIYGVDIMPMAVEIARLRAWLSLVLEAEYKPQDRKNNFGVSALPNLDFKFVCANSLIDSGYDAFLEKLDNKNATTATLFRLDGEVQKLEGIRDNYFDPKGDKHRKEQLQKEFTQTKNYIKTEFASLKKTWNLGDFLEKVDDWNPFDDSHPSTFFSPGWMFGIKEGFDVVIGNPPYVQLQNQGGRLAKLYEDEKYETFERTGDIYALFYEKGFQVLRRNGILVYITSNKWMRAAYGESLREFFIRKTNPLALIDFGGYQVFDATVDTNILIAEKAHFQNKVNTCVLSKDFSLDNMSDYFRQHSAPSKNFSSTTSWVILSAIEERIKLKIEKIGTPLKDWDVQINYGVKTGLNDAFIIDTQKRNELLEKSPKADAIIRPILLGKNIKRYKYEWENLWVIFTRRGIDITDYPSIRNYLMKFHDQLQPRNNNEQTGRKPGPYKWFEIQDNVAYFNEFERNKIAWGNLTLKSQFSFVDKGFYINAPSAFMATDNLYLLGILNSKLSDYYIKQLGVSRSGGYYEFKPMFVDKLPIPLISEKEQIPFQKIVKDIINRKKKGEKVEDLEAKIDEMTFRLYGLSDDEITMLTANKTE